MLTHGASVSRNGTATVSVRVSVRCREKFSHQATAPPACQPFDGNVGQALLPANPARPSNFPRLLSLREHRIAQGRYPTAGASLRSRFCKPSVAAARHSYLEAEVQTELHLPHGIRDGGDLARAGYVYRRVG